MILLKLPFDREIQYAGALLLFRLPILKKLQKSQKIQIKQNMRLVMTILIKMRESNMTSLFCEALLYQLQAFKIRTAKMQDNSFFSFIDESMALDISLNQKWIDDFVHNESYKDQLCFFNLKDIDSAEVYQKEKESDDYLSIVAPKSENYSNKEQPNSGPLSTQSVITKKQPKSKTGCNCKKTQCLKSYCECYSNGGYCNEGCGCVDCKNNASHQQKLEQSRLKKKLKFSGGVQHCQCKKSRCQKNYCECFNSGVPCGVNCKCEGCENCQAKSNQNSKNDTIQVQIQINSTT